MAGYGPIAIDSPSSRVATSLGLPMSAVAEDADSCIWVSGTGFPGVSFMVTGGTVARVHVDSGATATLEGARIGDTEARVESLYPGRVIRSPHKYTDGNYLTIMSPADTMRRIVFETDGRRVTTFRAGRMPEVEWIEGCS